MMDIVERLKGAVAVYQNDAQTQTKADRDFWLGLTNMLNESAIEIERLRAQLSSMPLASISSEKPNNSIEVLVESLREVIRISDRKHDAWDAVKEWLEDYEAKLLPKE
jgi:hypothetical protein